jgi:hypothetical protein
VEIAGWWAFLVAVWIATLNVFSVPEVIVAAATAVPCAFTARAARRAAGLRWALPDGWWRWLLALPGAVGHDTIGLLRLALGRRPREDDDEFRDVPLPAERTGAGRAGRAAGTVAALSATPGSVVVDTGEDHRTVRVHALPIGRTRLEGKVRRP